MLRHRQQRSTPILQKEPSQEVQDKFNKVEALVADVLSSTNGSATSSAAVAVESACRRARQKSKMMPSLGSGLVLAALDEVAVDVASLPNVSITNAEIMRQLTEDMINQPPSTPLRPRGAPPSSVRSIRGDQATPILESLESVGGVAGATKSEQPSSPGSTATQPHPSSVYTTIQEPSMDEEELESTAGTADAATTAHSIMAPLRQLLVDICTPEQQKDPECALIRRDLRLKKPNSGDMRLAREVDFDLCSSPKPPSAPEKVGKLGTPFGTPRLRGLCLEFGLDPTGRSPLKVEPLDQTVDQFNPMTPRGVSGAGGSRDFDTVFGGRGEIVTLKGEHAPRVSSAQKQHEQWRSGTTSPKSLSQGASPRGASGFNVGGLNVCESGAGAPPGLLPTARVEGSKESELGIGGERAGGEAAPSWFDPTEEKEAGESGTSMLPEINDVCSQLQTTGI